MQTYNELEIVMSLPKSKATAPLRKMQNIALNPFYNIQYLQHFFLNFIIICPCVVAKQTECNTEMQTKFGTCESQCNNQSHGLSYIYIYINPYHHISEESQSCLFIC